MSDALQIKTSELRLEKGDITLHDTEAFVYYARNDLALGSGFGNAIAQRGGPAIQEELKQYPPIETTRVISTTAGNLKARRILHAAGPKFQEPDTEEKLRATIHNCLKLAESEGISSLTFPPMGAGFYGIPLSISASITIGAIKAYLNNGASLSTITICCADNRELQAFQAALRA